MLSLLLGALVGDWSLFELFGHVANCCPVLSSLALLPAHFDEEPASEDLFVSTIADEVDGVDFGLEDDLERSGVVLLDLSGMGRYFDELVVGEGLLDVLLDGIEVALDEVEGDVLDVIIEFLDGIDQFFLLGHHELPPLLLARHHPEINITKNNPQ